MNIQARKLNAIKYLIGLKDEKIFEKIELTILESMKSKDLKKKKPYTQKQLIERAGRSNQDYHNGKFETQEELEIESQSW
ncbi:MAG: hypothetical protein IPN93_15990 [Bacteroidetes bacterium]|jgi:hypothetical protein|nr:hypothetical protein [Bacteroidota bacterium]MBK8674420.1 hypothetical protein [Bacteroidota bacterium]MBK9355473.1 hypothetical protein [Bacteroidota bacterium]